MTPSEGHKHHAVSIKMFVAHYLQHADPLLKLIFCN